MANVSKVHKEARVMSRIERHYSCGCSTTRIETNVDGAQLDPCVSHNAPLLRTVEIIEYAAEAEHNFDPLLTGL
jgi:hypothetical protein